MSLRLNTGVQSLSRGLYIDLTKDLVKNFGGLTFVHYGE